MAVVLLTGGVRSGKSAMAQRLLEDGGEVLYIATARCLDGEMERRIALHRASRPSGWKTVEASARLDRVLEENPGGTIVTDSITSSGLHRFIEELGGVHCRFRRGYKNVINVALRLNAAGVNAPLAIETSGHAALRENYFLDDGAYLATKLLIRAARMRREGGRLEHLIDRLAEPAESVEVRFPIAEADFRAYGQRVLEDLTALCGEREDWRLAPDSREGVRTTVGDGWLLLRLSVHDPVMPPNIESAAPGGCRAIASALTDFMSAEGGLDKSQLDAYLS